MKVFLRFLLMMVDGEKKSTFPEQFEISLSFFFISNFHPLWFYFPQRQQRTIRTTRLLLIFSFSYEQIIPGAVFSALRGYILRICSWLLLVHNVLIWFGWHCQQRFGMDVGKERAANDHYYIFIKVFHSKFHIIIFVYFWSSQARHSPTIINVCECVIENCLLVPFFLPHLLPSFRRPFHSFQSPRQQGFLPTRSSKGGQSRIGGKISLPFSVRKTLHIWIIAVRI